MFQKERPSQRSGKKAVAKAPASVPPRPASPAPKQNESSSKLIQRFRSGMKELGGMLDQDAAQRHPMTDEQFEKVRTAVLRRRTAGGKTNSQGN